MVEDYLVTGASGFVGANIVHRLVKDGKSVHIISRDKRPGWRLNSVADKIHFHQADLAAAELTPLLKHIRPDYVFHLACFGSLPEESNFSKMVKTNILGTSNLISAIKNYPVKLFINTGSSAEYKSKNGNLGENDQLQPLNDYGVSKAAQTLLCQKESLTHGLPIITLRLFSPFGYYEQGTRLIPHIILRSLQDREIPLSNPTFVRDFIFIEDVVDAYLSACKIKPRPGEIFNIASGQQQSIKNVTNTILKLTGSKSHAVYGKVKKQSRQIEPVSWQADISKARKELKWQPKYSLKDGLRETLTWFKENKELYVN